jgi:NADH/NAD ratio-sensing transcriptional regulator Rex
VQVRTRSIAEVMIAGRIQAIWHFAPVRLRGPARIILHNQDLYSSLASLWWKLARRFQVPIQQVDGGMH